jgi:NADPH:quinone reductase-like Zn-dependent oxidoreductase
MECFATVEESRSAEFSVGDPVIPLVSVGGWASHAVAHAENLIRVPDGIDPLQASMLRVNPATAWLLLRHFTTLEEGDWVALNAANSGVGQCLVQLAAAMGVRTACFLRDPGLAEDLTDLGATAVFEDSAEGHGQAAIILGGSKCKLAFNAVGGDSAFRLVKLLCNGGSHITYGAMARKPLTIPNGPLIFGDIRFRGLWVTNWIKEATRAEVESTYQALARLIANGRLRQRVDSTFPLENYRDVLARLESDQRRGKVIFQPEA